MLTHDDHVQHVYCAILIDVLAYPTDDAYFAPVLANTYHVKHIDRTIHIDIPYCVHCSIGLAQIADCTVTTTLVR